MIKLLTAPIIEFVSDWVSMFAIADWHCLDFSRWIAAGDTWKHPPGVLMISVIEREGRCSCALNFGLFVKNVSKGWSASGQSPGRHSKCSPGYHRGFGRRTAHAVEVKGLELKEGTEQRRVERRREPLAV